MADRSTEIKASYGILRIDGQKEVEASARSGARPMLGNASRDIGQDVKSVGVRIKQPFCSTEEHNPSARGTEPTQVGKALFQRIPVPAEVSGESQSTRERSEHGFLRCTHINFENQERQPNALRVLLEFDQIALKVCNKVNATGVRASQLAPIPPDRRVADAHPSILTNEV